MSATHPPAGAPRKSVVLKGLERRDDVLHLTVGVAGEEDLIVIIAPRDGRAAWVHTQFLALQFRGSDLSLAHEAALRSVAATLKTVRFDTLAERAVAPPETPAPAAQTPQADTEVITVDVWGNSDRWRTFSLRREFLRNAGQLIQLVGGQRVVTVTHSESECDYATPRIDSRTMSMYNYPWVRPLEPPRPKPKTGPHLPGLLTTDLRDPDVIGGGTPRLEALLSNLAPQTADGDLVIVKSSCLPNVFGDDIEGVVSRWQGKGEIRFEDIFAPPRRNFVADLVSEAIHSAEIEHFDVPAVNIAGVAPGPVQEELQRLLDKAEIKLNGFAVPAIDLQRVPFWRNARAQVLLLNPYYRTIYAQVFEKLDMPTLILPSLYGLRATLSCLAEIGRICERPEAMADVLAQAEASVAPALEQCRLEAAQHRLGFVLAADEYEALCDPMESAGVPLLDLAIEFGFGLHLMVYQPAGLAATPLVLRPEHAAAALVEHFSTGPQLEALLRSEASSAVYSDLYGDERLVAAGKAGFSLQFFEMGLQGAVRTAEQLLGACRLPFYRKYGRHGRA